MSTVTQQPIPLCDLKLLHAPIDDDIRLAIDRVLESQAFIMGPEVRELESDIAAYCGTSDAVGCSSGSDALLLALMALDIGPGDEVITSPFTFFATAGAISRLGATPVFVDIKQDTYNIDPEAVRTAVTDKTKAIIPVHLFGQMAEMDSIMKIARAHDLFVIEDAAQAIGAEYKGQRAGSIGTVGCFSFFPSKNLGCFGDGGMVSTNDPVLATKMRAIRTHGATKKYFHETVGANLRLDTIHAAVLLVKLPHLDSWHDSRNTAADRYRELITDAGLADQIVLPTHLPDRRHVYNQFCIRAERRDELVAHFRELQIGTAIYYPKSLHVQECFKDLGHKEGELPVSEKSCQEIMALPMFPGIGEEPQQSVVAAIKSFFS